MPGGPQTRLLLVGDKDAQPGQGSRAQAALLLPSCWGESWPQGRARAGRSLPSGHSRAQEVPRLAGSIAVPCAGLPCAPCASPLQRPCWALVLIFIRWGLSVCHLRLHWILHWTVLLMLLICIPKSSLAGIHVVNFLPCCFLNKNILFLSTAFITGWLLLRAQVTCFALWCVRSCRLPSSDSWL